VLVLAEVWSGQKRLTMLQANSAPDAVEKECATKLFPVSTDCIDLSVVKRIIRLRLEDCGEALPLEHDCEEERLRPQCETTDSTTGCARSPLNLCSQSWFPSEVSPTLYCIENQQTS
jgi:hypothetical protein